MKRSLQSMIDNRENIDRDVIFHIIDMFSKGQNREKRQKIKDILLNKFYTVFDGNEITKCIYIDKTDIFFLPVTKNKIVITLKSAREYILSYGD